MKRPLQSDFMVMEYMKPDDVPPIAETQTADPDLIRLASSPKTHPDTLAALAESEDVFVRCTVAQNPNTPQTTLFQLLLDTSLAVR